MAVAGTTLFWLSVLLVTALTYSGALRSPPPAYFFWWLAKSNAIPYACLHMAALLLAWLAPETDRVLRPVPLLTMAAAFAALVLLRWKILPPAGFDRDVLLIATMLGQGYGVKHHAMASAAALRRSRLQVRAAELEAGILKAQLRPEFVARVLAEIGELLARDAAAADRLVLRTGELLRMALKHSRTSTASLHDEAAYLDAYVELARIRSPGALRIWWTLDAAVEAAPVPNLILLPLIDVLLASAEDSPAGDAGIHVAARAEPGGVLRLAVRGSGRCAFRAAEIRATNAYEELQARLRLLFPRASTLWAAEGPGGGEVIATLPLSPPSDREPVPGSTPNAPAAFAGST